MSLIAAVPFVLAALIAPALLSLAPTVDMIAPIAEARAVQCGRSLVDLNMNRRFFLFLLMAGDLFADAPGRIHLSGKSLRRYA